jgi:hypothetical protein
METRRAEFLVLARFEVAHFGTIGPGLRQLGVGHPHRAESYRELNTKPIIRLHLIGDHEVRRSRHFT